ncbi:ankyrin repeat domain-containing protein [Actinobacillus capsulatus]|uniref:ankyrin repeat domain-containing protein n=1 Tax=Actinobacillus capsulatus TaxID=717 RepID=UPI00036DFC21|nr:ankyrin repeat domain-containing protein [Actinobacillus capsulatus]
MKKQTPFPTVLENMRALMNILDLQIPDSKEKKQLDDQINNPNVRQELIDHFFKVGIKKPIEKLLPHNISSEIITHLKEHFKDYVSNLVRNTDVDSLSRVEIMSILNQYYFPVAIIRFRERIPEHYLPSPEQIERILDKDTNSFQVVFDWLKEDKNWVNYVEQLKNKEIEEFNKLYRWKTGEYLPSYQAILNLGKNSKGKQKLGNSVNKIKFWIFIARAPDKIKESNMKDSFFDGIYLDDAFASFCMNKSIHQKQKEVYAPILPTMINCLEELNTHLLSQKTKKTEMDRDKSQTLIKAARKALEGMGDIANHQYHLDKLEARWELFSGNLEKAVELYEKAFENGLFRAGRNLDEIIKESLISTAFLEKSQKVGKRKFLSHLKNAAIMFGIELPSIDNNSIKINHKDIISDWEVDMWARNFSQYFPKEGLFPDVNYDYESWQDRSISLSQTMFDDFERIKPDYKKPDRIVSIGNGAKRMPQIVYFASKFATTYKNEDLEIIKKLLEYGADVNGLSNASESALLWSLELLNLWEIPLRKQSKQLFDLIIKYEHNKETINTKTAKKQKYPLMLAVESGRSDVVQKLLEMGAIPDLTGFDKETPLYKCLRMLTLLSNPKSVLKRTDMNNIDKKQLSEYLRRNRYGLEGVFLDDLERLYKNISAPSKFQYEQLKTYSSINELYKIMELLIAYGANVNFPINVGGIEGYTPFMLAIENNDPVAFAMMLKAGGDIWQPCYCNGKRYFCKDIKARWNSDKISW